MKKQELVAIIAEKANAIHTHSSHVYSRGEDTSFIQAKEIMNGFLPPEKQY